MRESPYRILEETLRPHLGARAQELLEELASELKRGA